MNTRSTRKKSRKRFETLPRDFKLSTAAQQNNAATPAQTKKIKKKKHGSTMKKAKNKAWSSTLKTPINRRTRNVSSDLLRAASSPTSAAARCAETLKKSFSAQRQQASINVFVRVRPTTLQVVQAPDENSENKHPTHNNDDSIDEEEEEPSFNVESENTLIHRISGQQGKRFIMDKIFEEDSTQEEVFERIGRQQVDKAMSGFHGSIFAYGQTSTGKTYTMLGPNGGRGDLSSKEVSKEVGLIPRILHYLFQVANSKKDATTATNTTTTTNATATNTTNTNNNNSVQKITVSYLEIYNETLRDLLNVTSEDGGITEKRQNLPIKEHKRDGPFVKGLTEKVVTCPEDALKLMEIGNAARSQAKTRMNNTSSRSHAVFTIRIDGIMNSTTADGRKRKFSSKINLVDLAGSERQRNTGAEGKRLREGSAINKSLSVLGTVIMNLVDIGDGRSRHVHYRDSKLTFLLRDSLGGSTFTSIIATVTSKEEHAQETLSTLHFAQRAKSVKNVVTRNVEVVDTVSGLRRELRSLKKQLKGKGNSGDDDLIVKQHKKNHKIELNEHIRKAAEQEMEMAEMEKRYKLIIHQQIQAQKEAAKKEKELDSLRMAHAKKASERRRSSVGYTGRESSLFSILESPKASSSMTTTTSTTNVETSSVETQTYPIEKENNDTEKDTHVASNMNEEMNEEMNEKMSVEMKKNDVLNLSITNLNNERKKEKEEDIREECQEEMVEALMEQASELKTMYTEKHLIELNKIKKLLHIEQELNKNAMQDSKTKKETDGLQHEKMLKLKTIQKNQKEMVQDCEEELDRFRLQTEELETTTNALIAKEEEWNQKEIQYQNELQILRNQRNEQSKEFNQISSAAGEVQTVDKENIQTLENDLMLTQKELEVKEDELKSAQDELKNAQDEASVLRERVQILVKEKLVKNKKKKKENNNETIVKTIPKDSKSIKSTTTVADNRFTRGRKKSKKNLSLDVSNPSSGTAKETKGTKASSAPSAPSTPSIMSMTPFSFSGINIASTTNNPTSATALLAAVDISKSMKGNRDSSDSVSSNDSNDSNDEKKLRPRKSRVNLRDMFKKLKT